MSFRTFLAERANVKHLASASDIGVVTADHFSLAGETGRADGRHISNLGMKRNWYCWNDVLHNPGFDIPAACRRWRTTRPCREWGRRRRSIGAELWNDKQSLADWANRVRTVQQLGGLVFGWPSFVLPLWPSSGEKQNIFLFFYSKLFFKKEEEKLRNFPQRTRAPHKTGREKVQQRITKTDGEKTGLNSWRPLLNDTAAQLSPRDSSHSPYMLHKTGRHGAQSLGCAIPAIIIKQSRFFSLSLFVSYCARAKLDDSEEEIFFFLCVLFFFLKKIKMWAI